MSSLPAPVVFPPDPLTRIDTFDIGIEFLRGRYCVKREDLACYERIDWPTGAKVRQYLKMIAAQPGAPLLVGCSAFSLMQVYVAAAAEKFNVPGIIYVPGRAVMSDATRYAVNKGVDVCEVRPCPGPNVYKARAKERAAQLPSYVRWDFIGALTDAMYQAQNIPEWVTRVLVPTGSGLICSGILAGLAGRNVLVVAVSGSTMAHADTILKNAARLTSKPLPRFVLFRSPERYEEFLIEALPDLTPLDPFYAAKMYRYRRPNDCLWLTGLRPISSMPAACQHAFSYWTDDVARVRAFSNNGD